MIRKSQASFEHLQASNVVHRVRTEWSHQLEENWYAEVQLLVGKWRKGKLADKDFLSKTERYFDQLLAKWREDRNNRLKIIEESNFCFNEAEKQKKIARELWDSVLMADQRLHIVDEAKSNPQPTPTLRIFKYLEHV